jgi:thioredoxin reductase/ferredoxin
VTLIVPAVLGGIALCVMALVSVAAARRHRRGNTGKTGTGQPRILIHNINDDRCTGCDACVAVCPTNVLDLVNNKSRVLRFQDCIQCEACMWACPTEALVMHVEGTEPPPLRVPELDGFYQTAVPGQYLIGEVAGKPLVKNAANLGRAVVEHMLQTGLRRGARTAEGSDAREVSSVDVAIIGSGPGGLSAALTCIHHGLSYVVLEKENIIASTVARYPKGKLVMAEPYDTRNVSFLPVFDSSKEQLIPLWQEIIAQVGLRVQMGEHVEEVKRRGDGSFDVRTIVRSYRAQRVILATGTRGKPRTLSAPGENLPKVSNLLEDPAHHRGQNVIVVGGGDSALEAAVALADAGAKVVLSYRGKLFNRAAPKNRQLVESYAEQRRIKVKYQSQVVEFTETTVTLAMADGSHKKYPNEAAFVLIGADPPVEWLKKMSIEFVERPHSYTLGKTDDLVRRLVSTAQPCPEDAAGAVALLRGEQVAAAVPPPTPDRRPRSVPPPVPEPVPVSGPRQWLRSATNLFATGAKLDKPMPLSEFAKRSRRHSGNGRRDKLNPAERTRVLRMLRDEGGRLADEDSRVFEIEEMAPAPAPRKRRRSSAPPPPPPLRSSRVRSPSGSPPPLHLDEEAAQSAVLVGLGGRAGKAAGRGRRDGRTGARASDTLPQEHAALRDEIQDLARTVESQLGRSSRRRPTGNHRLARPSSPPDGRSPLASSDLPPPLVEGRRTAAMGSSAPEPDRAPGVRPVRRSRVLSELPGQMEEEPTRSVAPELLATGDERRRAAVVRSGPASTLGRPVRKGPPAPNGRRVVDIHEESTKIGDVDAARLLSLSDVEFDLD